MARYVDAERAHIYLNTEACEQIKSMPTANVRPVKHGHNADMSSNRNSFLCSKCGIFIKLKAYNATEEIDFNVKFCPSCGAKMDGKDGEDNG